MVKTHIRCLLTLALLALLAAPAKAREPRLQTGELSVASDAGEVRSDGRFVAWTEPATPGSKAPRNLYAAALASGERRLVASGLDASAGLAIDDGTLVWLDAEGQNHQRTLRATDLASGKTTEIARGPVREPAIHGALVVWFENGCYPQGCKTRTAQIKRRDLKTLAEPALVAEIDGGPGSLGWTHTNGEVIVWGVITSGERYMSGRDIWSISVAGTNLKKLDGVLSGTEDDMILVGGILVYGKNGAIVVRELGGGQSVIRPADWPQAVASDGRFVFYTHYGPEQGTISTLPVELWGFDRAAGSRFLLTRIVNNGAYYPSLAQGTLVWRERRDDHNLIKFASLGELLPSARRPQPSAPTEARYFPETGHTLGGIFQAYWAHNGGLAVFGYPLTEELVEWNVDQVADFRVQYLERERYEHHPEHRGTPYEVQLGRLGADLLRLQGRDWQTFPKVSPEAPHYFPETGHAVDQRFWAYWSGHGLDFGDPGISQREALALFGLPLSEAQLETNSSGDTVLTQWFERARFEYHPHNPQPNDVLLGRLGAELLERRGWSSGAE